MTIPQSFSLTRNGTTEVFRLGDDYGPDRWTGNGYKKLIGLGVWTREIVAGKLKTQPPTVAAILALVSGNRVDASLPPADETAPINPQKPPVHTAGPPVLIPQVARMPSALPSPPAAADTPEVVAERVHRTSADAEEIRAKFGWDDIISQINAEARPSRDRQ
jgi:hypothetical protein